MKQDSELHQQAEQAPESAMQLQLTTDLYPER
jgi:hypothetical protein